MPDDDDNSTAASFVLEVPNNHSAQRPSACEEVYNNSAYNKQVLFAMCTGLPVPGDLLAAIQLLISTWHLGTA
jgi:hypothetical protein